MLTYSTSTDADPKQGGGMFALRLADGERVWYTPPAGCGTRPRCSPAQSAAVSAIPGVAFSGSVDGHMRAYSTTDGTIVWDVDTIDVYEAVNGVLGRGGSLDGPGPVDRQRHRLREFRLPDGRRHAGQRPAGFFGGRKIGHRPQAPGHGPRRIRRAFLFAGYGSG